MLDEAHLATIIIMLLFIFGPADTAEVEPILCLVMVNAKPRTPSMSVMERRLM